MHPLSTPQATGIQQVSNGILCLLPALLVCALFSPPSRLGILGAHLVSLEEILYSSWDCGSQLEDPASSAN